MKARKITESVSLLGAVDWDRRFFDALIPIPDGTSYNSYLIKGSEKIALLDTVEPAFIETLLSQLNDIPSIDYVISHHAEQDHSGSLPQIMEKYPHARLLTSIKGKGMLMDLMPLQEDRIQTVQDGETISLGDKTLEFIYTPWVHWPETMVTYLREEKILFACDFFGSHLATSDLYATDESRVYGAARLYYAQIMMPFRGPIQKNLEKIALYQTSFIAPSHGPVYNRPEMILSAYREWASDKVMNIVILPYVSMHGSVKKMVDHLVGALAEKGVTVHQFDLTTADLGRLASTLVDAATLVIGTSVVLNAPHPHVFHAAHLVNILRPKLKYAAVIGSFGWGGKAIEDPSVFLPNLKIERLPSVLCRGIPHEDDFKALDTLAATIASKHAELGLK